MEYENTVATEEMVRANDLLRQMEAMRSEIDKLNQELRHMRSDNECLKECIVRMTLKREGVANG